MTKVYIVRYGCYSDQGISGVFSTRKKADKFCAVYNEVEGYSCGDTYWVDERVLDENEIKGDIEVATYSRATVTLEDVYTGGYLEYKAGEVLDGGNDIMILTEPVIVEEYDNEIWVYSTFGIEHAKKVAIEKYQIYTQQKLGNGEI